MNDKERDREIKLAINKLYHLTRKSRTRIVELTKEHEYRLLVIVAHLIRNKEILK